MSEQDNDSFYWEPEVCSPLRQGDLLLNVPVTVIPDQPEFVIRGTDGAVAEISQYPAFPDYAPSDEFITVGDWGALSMIVTPTCHVSEDEKAEEIVAVVPVQPAFAVVNQATVEKLRSDKNDVHHLFYLPPTDLGGALLPFDAVALLDRPASFPRHQLKDYRRLGLFRDQRYELRKKLAWFWARASADEALETDLEAKIKHNVSLERIE
jgi:hypothetical protein